MRHIRELLRLKFENGLPGRLIAASLGLSKGAVHDYLGRLAAAGLSWPLPEDLSDTALERRLFPGPPSAGSPGRPEPNWAYVDAELRRKGVTRSLLWQEYRADHPEGYGYAWFCQHFDAWKGRVSATMRQRHGAGEKVFVDYAGDTLDIIDPATGAAPDEAVRRRHGGRRLTPTPRPGRAKGSPTGSAATSACSPSWAESRG
jgi:transposase